MQRVKLDDIDRRILAYLQEDGRITNVELARRVGISAPPCLRRVRALEEAGYIRGYHADVNEELLDYRVTAFARVALESQAESDLNAFEELVRGWPLVRECYMLNGEDDFVLRVVAHDLESFNRFLTQHLTTAPNVAHVRTSLAIRNSKRQAGVPLEFSEDLPADIAT